MTRPATHTSFFARAFNTPVLQKSRMPWVDYLRAIAIILVVYRHSLIGIQRSGIEVPNYLVNANMIFYSFRMPLFFIVSALFISSSLAKKGLKQLTIIKFENLVYPYLVWTVIQITLQIIFSGYVNSDRSWKDYTYILYQPRALDQFWYLPALFNTTIIYLLIKTKFQPPAWAQIVLGLTFYFLSPFLYKVSMMRDWMEFYIFFAIGDLIARFFFRDQTQRFLKSSWALLAMIPIFVLSQLFYLKQHTEDYYHDIFWGQAEFLPIAFIGCLTMFLLAFRLQIWNILTFLRVLGYHSLYIYVIHVLVIAFMRMLLSKFLGIHDPLVLLLTCIAFGVTLPVIFYNLVVKDNIGWFLFSYRKPRKGEMKTE